VKYSDDGLRFASPTIMGDVMKSLAMLATMMGMVLFSSHVVCAEAAESLKVGQPAPDFSLPDQNGKTRTLEDFRGKWLALYFYVKDDTPGCTEQACKFRDDIHELTDLGAQVVGVSVDDTASHANFAKKYNLPFPLLADSKGETAARYDSLRGDGSLAKRNSFLIDPQGRIAKVYLSASTSRNSAEIIEDLKKLKGSAGS
jgi:thioredoxin-dependent peroxiredoxin